MKILLSLFEKLKNSPGKTLLLIATFITIFNVIISWKYNFYKYSKRELALQLIGETHGIALDIVILGVLMVWITNSSERKKNVTQAMGEIDDLRYHTGEYITVRMLRNIKTLQGYDVNKLDLHSIQLSNSMFRMYNLSESNLTSFISRSSHFQGTNLRETVLFNADLSHSDLSNADLSGSKADQALFISAYCINTRFKNASLVGANFSGAKINQGDFTDSNITGAIFEGTALYRVDFRGSLGLTATMFEKTKYIIECQFDEKITEQLKKLDFPKSAKLAWS